MMFEKEYIGENNLENLQLRYYVIKHNNLFGIEIEESQGNKILCDYEYFTEQQNEALSLATEMYKGLVTLTTMTEIIDDYIA